MKRIIMALAVLALVAPGLGHADTTYEPAYEMGPQGGDDNNTIMADPATGEMTVLRHQVAGVTGGLGCGGSGGYASFKVAHTGENVTGVTVHHSDTIVDPYTWISVSVKQDGDYLATHVERGLIVGEGEITVTLPEAASGDMEILFGIQVSSACPNVDGGTAIFHAVDVIEG